MDVRHILRHGCRRPERTQVAKLSTTLQHRPPARQCRFEKSLFSMGLEVRTEHFLDSAAARGICRCEGVGTVRHLSSKVLRLQQLVKRGVVVLGACTHPQRTAQTWGRSHYPSKDCDRRGNGTAWCWNGQKEDGQDDGEQRRAAVQTTSDRGQVHGGVLEAPGGPVTAFRWTE